MRNLMKKYSTEDQAAAARRQVELEKSRAEVIIICVLSVICGVAGAEVNNCVFCGVLKVVELEKSGAKVIICVFRMCLKVCFEF